MVHIFLFYGDNSETNRKFLDVEDCMDTACDGLTRLKEDEKI